MCRSAAKKEVEYLAEQICRLVEAAHGHTLVLFTSYALMGAVYNQIKDRLSFSFTGGMEAFIGCDP